MGATVAKPTICPRCEGPLVDLSGPDPEVEGPLCLLIDETHYECKLCTCKPTDRFSCLEFPRVVPAPDATPKQLADRKRDCTERRRAMSESNSNATINPRQEMEWLEDAAAITKRVADGEIILAPIFWLRLFGILHDMYDKLLRAERWSLGQGFRFDPRISAFMREVEALSAVFTEDERLYIQYRRDVEAHPIQVAYEFRIDGAGKAKEAVTTKITAKKLPVTLDEFRAAMGRVLATAKHETGIARAFAIRCALSLERVREKGLQIFTG
jgi:hypothetical protein